MRPSSKPAKKTQSRSKKPVRTKKAPAPLPAVSKPAKARRKRSKPVPEAAVVPDAAEGPRERGIREDYTMRYGKK